MATRKELRAWLIEGEIERVVDALPELADRYGDKYYQNDVIHLAGRFNSLKKDYNAGLLDANTYSIRLNNIRRALQELVDKLPEGAEGGSKEREAVEAPIQPATGQDTAFSMPPKAGIGSQDAPWIVGLFLLVGTAIVMGALLPCPTPAQEMAFRLLMALGGGLAAIKIPGLFQLEMQGVKAGSAIAVFALIYMVNPASVASGGGCSGGPFEFTINLQPKVTGARLYPQLKEGTVQLYVENKWEPARIDPDGLADFKSLPASLKDSRTRIRLKAPFWKLSQNSIVLKGKSVTLEAVPDGSLGKVTGQIVDESGMEPLPGVMVLVHNQRDTTDEFGEFKINIPLALQRQQYAISARKAGYKTLSRRFELDGNGAPVQFRMVKE